MNATRQQGFVLVCVLWILAILTVLTLGFGRRALMDRAAATYSLDHAKALHMARGAVARGIIELQNKATHDFLSNQEGRTSYSQTWAEPKDLLQEPNLFSDAESEEMAGDLCMYSIRDESGLLSVNAAPEELLEGIKALNRTAMRKIRARRTGGSDDNPYPQPFQTIEEIRDWPGISDKEWFGTDEELGLKDVLTCWGDARININTAPKEVLACIPDVRDNFVENVLAYRAGSDGELYTSDDQDFASLDQVADKVGGGRDILKSLNTFCKVDSGSFTIIGIATRRNGKITATCVATVQMMGAAAAIIKWREELFESQVKLYHDLAVRRTADKQAAAQDIY